jgi:uncharacterized protein
MSDPLFLTLVWAGAWNEPIADAFSTRQSGQSVCCHITFTNAVRRTKRRVNFFEEASVTWVARLLPKEEHFFPLFEDHADKLATAAGKLQQLLEGGSNTRQHCEQLSRLDKDATQSARKVLDAVRSTFIAPFDRVAIKSLILEMDGSLHEMHKTGRAVALFEVDRFEPCMQEIGNVIVECTELVKRAMPLLSDVDRKAIQITDICRDITARKEQTDEIADRGVKQLFKNKRGEAMVFIVNNTIYDHLDAVVDRLETVGDHIHDVVIDHV